MAKKKLSRQHTIDKQVMKQHSERKSTTPAEHRRHMSQVNHSRKYGAKKRGK